jgi:hypothetical protein
VWCQRQIKAVDYGPGFTDVTAALEIESQPGKGAIVTAKKWAKSRAV